MSEANDRTRRDNDDQVSSKGVQNVKEDLLALELRREQPLAIFVFDMKELTIEPSKWHEKIVMSLDND